MEGEIENERKQSGDYCRDSFGGSGYKVENGGGTTEEKPRFLSQIIGEMDVIHIVGTRNILGMEGKEFNLECDAFNLFM